jgi:hypothetical protein
MPWFPEFSQALARRQIRAAGQADPVTQFVAALNNGDTHALETVWPGEVVIHDPRDGEIRGRKQVREFVSHSGSWLAERRPYGDRGLHRHWRAGRGGTAGAPDPRRAGSGVAGDGRR